MRRRRSLEDAFTWWFAGTLLLLYGVLATVAAVDAATDAERDVVMALKSEAEAVAAYVAATGRLDTPELEAPEREPVPLWLRVVAGGEVVAATPGAPALPELPPDEAAAAARGEAVTVEAAEPGAVILVRHAVGGLGQGLAVEAVGSTAPLVASRRRLRLVLVLVGLIVIPAAAFGGRLLARWALRPVDALVAAIGTIDSERLGERLTLPADAAVEVATLAGAFNRLLDRLQASVEATRRFTADASHELRNPLSVLRTGLEVALRRPRPAEEYRDLLRRNLEEIQRVQTVVEGLLTLARDAPGQREALEPEPVDLARLSEQTAAAFAAVAGEAGIAVELRVPALTLTADPRLLRLLLFNLLDNAIKHSPDGGRVVLAAEACGGGVRLVVEDSGPGVAPEDRGRLFDRFYRPRRAAGQGVGGLGLAVVRWVAEAHGGTVALLDREQGAAFEVVLPLAPPAAAA